jgi:hypothetical protein
MSLLANTVPTARSGSALCPSPIAVDGHTMAPDRLLRYLQIKVHHLIQDHDWDSIHVVGGYDREAVISAHEKTGKLFNFERPTADVQGRDLIVKAFPGADYVHHYALIIATYLSMIGKPADTVTYELPDPTLSRDAVGKLDLELDGDLVIVGWGLAHLAPPDGVWNHGHGYAWQHTEIHGRQVVYLGFLHSIWGDVAGRVVTRLAELGAREVVYVGKVGALNPDIEPNTRLATGNTSLVGGGFVTWPDFFSDFATAQAGVHTWRPRHLALDPAGEPGLADRARRTRIRRSGDRSYGSRSTRCRGRARLSPCNFQQPRAPLPRGLVQRASQRRCPTAHRSDRTDPRHYRQPTGRSADLNPLEGTT